MKKIVRFEVFKRDSFTCQYCGKTPPQAVLEVDHINPVSSGGTDEINNLITACFECNRGKRNIPLETVPNTLATNLEILKEREVQLREYNRFVEKIKRRERKEALEVSNIYNKHFPKWVLSDSFLQRVKIFMRQIPRSEVMEAMEIACTRIKHKDEAISYFCGICWKKIKNTHVWNRS